MRITRTTARTACSTSPIAQVAEKTVPVNCRKRGGRRKAPHSRASVTAEADAEPKTSRNTFAASGATAMVAPSG